MNRFSNAESQIAGFIDMGAAHYDSVFYVLIRTPKGDLNSLLEWLFEDWPWWWPTEYEINMPELPFHRIEEADSSGK